MSNAIDNNVEAFPATGKLVCVTGASGYIASWIVKFLLQRGYTVRASVRDPNDAKKVEHLRSLDGAKERLHIFKADLVEEGSFDTAIHGCDGVFHTASPCFLGSTDPQAELIDPAVNGTLNVYKSCAKASSVKRVVLTSSFTAVMSNPKPQTPGLVVDETWWSDKSFCTEQKLWYFLSKTLAEEAAWNFVKEKGIDMVAMNPSMVIGPLLQPTLNSSASLLLNLINAAETYPNINIGVVNVKDVAKAHILAYEVSSASGRYCLVEKVYHYSEMIALLRQLYPNLSLPKKCVDEHHIPIFWVSNEKTKSLGLQYTPLEISLKETVESFKEKKFLRF